MFGQELPNVAGLASGAASFAASAGREAGGIAKDIVTDPKKVAILTATAGFAAPAVLGATVGERAGTAVGDPESVLGDTSGMSPEEIQGKLEERLPLSVGFVSSVQATGHRLANPTEYARAAKRGELGLVLLEDLANVTLVLGPATRAAGGTAGQAAGRAASKAAVRRATASALEKEAARATERVTSRAGGLGRAVGDVGIAEQVSTGGARAAQLRGGAGRLRAGAQPLEQRAARLGQVSRAADVATFGPVNRAVGRAMKRGTGAVLGPAFRALRRSDTALGRKLDDTAKRVTLRREIRQVAEERVLAGEAELINPIARAYRVVERIVDNDAEGVAAMVSLNKGVDTFADPLVAHRRRVAGANMTAAERAAVEDFNRSLVESVTDATLLALELPADDAVVREGVQIALRRASGELDDAARSRINRAREVYLSEIKPDVERRFLDDFGAETLPADEAGRVAKREARLQQLGDQPLDVPAEPQTVLGREVQRTTAQVERQQKRAARARGAAEAAVGRRVTRPTRGAVQEALSLVSSFFDRALSKGLRGDLVDLATRLGVRRAAKASDDRLRRELTDRLLAAARAGTDDPVVRQVLEQLPLDPALATPRLGGQATLGRRAGAARAAEVAGEEAARLGTEADRVAARVATIAEDVASAPTRANRRALGRLEKAVRGAERAKTQLGRARRRRAQRAGTGRPEAEGAVLRAEVDAVRDWRRSVKAEYDALIAAEEQALFRGPISRNVRFPRKGDKLAAVGPEDAALHFDDSLRRQLDRADGESFELWIERANAEFGGNPAAGFDEKMAFVSGRFDLHRRLRRERAMVAKINAGVDAEDLAGTPLTLVPEGEESLVLGSARDAAVRNLTGGEGSFLSPRSGVDFDKIAAAVRAAQDNEILGGRATRPEGFTGEELAIFDESIAEIRAQGTARNVGAVREQVAGRIAAQARAQGQREGRRLGAAEGRLAGLEGAEERLGAVAGREGRRTGDLPATERETAAAGFAEGARAGQTFTRRDLQAKQALRVLGVEEARLERVVVRYNNVLVRWMDSIEAAPARYRPALTVARSVEDSMATMVELGSKVGIPEVALDSLRRAMSELPTTLQRAVDVDINPTFLQGGKAAAPDLPKGGTALPRTVQTGESKFRGTAALEVEPAKRFLVESGRARTQVMNETVRFLETQYGTSAGKVLGRTPRQILSEVPEGTTGVALIREMEAARFRAAPGVTPENVGMDSLFLPGDLLTSPNELVQAMSREGFVPWAPSNPFGGPVTPDATAQFIPKAVIDEWRKWFDIEQGAVEAALQTADVGIRFWKASVLAWSPRWHVGNIVGNSIMATLGAGIDPVTYAGALGQALRTIRRQQKGKLPQRGLFPERIRGVGPAGEARDFFRAGQQQLRAGRRGRVRGPFGKITDASFAFNQFLDDANRYAVYLVKVRRGVEPERAIRMSLRAVGDFTRMTPFERQFIRRVIPFYAWLRHITQLSWNLAVDHPLRVVWTLHMLDLYAEPSSGLSFLDSAIPLGGERFVMMPNINPFGDVPLLPQAGESPGESLARDIGFSISPAFKLPLQAVGVDPNRGFKPLSTPPGDIPLDQFGSDRNIGIADDPVGFAKVVLQQFPQARVALDVTEEQVVRYPNRRPVRVRGDRTIPTGRDDLDVLSRFVGLPTVESVEVDEILRRRREAEREKERLRGGSRSTEREPDRDSGGRVGFGARARGE
ncbi:MAG: hypothetical protein GY795_17675 [Desulfobacterales bacterium]|nr:hypothetical protein [Desulfobacterales bacterium]